MDIHISRQFPIPVSDLESISNMLQDANVLCGTANPMSDWYDPMWYAMGQAVEELTFILLLDRNVYSLLTQLANDQTRASSEPYRLAAAVLCFAQCCDLACDSRIAVLENELDCGTRKFSTEHPKFLQVLSSQTPHLADFALARRNTLTLSPTHANLLTKLPTLSEANRPSYWKLNYGCALKLASLILDDRYADDADRALAYLNWCYRDYCFSSAATVYGSLALSPQRKPKMFKRLRGTRVDEAMHGIRNATWDMTLLTEWEERMKAELPKKKYRLICSFDQAIMAVAPNMMSQEPDETLRQERLRATFISAWNEKDAAKLLTTYETMKQQCCDDPKRPANQDPPLSFWDTKISELELTVKETIDRQGGS